MSPRDRTPDHHDDGSGASRVRPTDYADQHTADQETMTNASEPQNESQIQDVIDRILAADAARASSHRSDAQQSGDDGEADGLLSGRALALSEGGHGHTDDDGEQYDLAERQALRRVGGLSTELEDMSEVEYRQLRLERVVLAGIWTEGTAEDAENSLRELAALAETAGSEVLDGVIQRRQTLTRRPSWARARPRSCARSWP